MGIDWKKITGLYEGNPNLLPGNSKFGDILGGMAEKLIPDLKQKMTKGGYYEGPSSTPQREENPYMSQMMAEMRRQRELQEAEARRRREMYNRLTGILDSYELTDEEKGKVAAKREELRARVIEDYKIQSAQMLEARTREQESEAASRGISGGLARKGENQIKGRTLGQVASMRAQMPMQVADDVRNYEQDYRRMLDSKADTALGMFGSSGDAAVKYAQGIGSGLRDLSSLYQDESQFGRQRADQRWYYQQQMNQWDAERRDANKGPGFWDIVGNVGEFAGNILPW